MYIHDIVYIKYYTCTGTFDAVQLSGPGRGVLKPEPVSRDSVSTGPQGRRYGRLAPERPA